MKKIIIILVCIFLIFTTIAIGQAREIAIGKDDEIKPLTNGDKWIKTFGDNWDDYGFSVIKADDGGYAIIGSTYPSNKGVAWLIKTDINGNMMWESKFEEKELHGYGWFPLSFKQTNDGGYIILATVYSDFENKSDLWLIKTDSYGNKVWDKIFDNDNRYDYNTEVIQNDDGGYTFTGYNREEDGSSGIDLLLINTDSRGDMIWSITYGGDGSDYGMSLKQTNDGGYIIAGYTNSKGAGKSDVWLLKTDSEGELVWDKTYGEAEHDKGHSVQQTNDGGYIITGLRLVTSDTLYEVLLLKTDSDGEQLWEKTYGKNDYFETGRSVKQTNDGGYIITGDSHRGKTPSAYYTNSLLIKTNSQGDEEWIKYYGGIYHGKNNLANSVQQTSDGGYIFTGYNSRGLSSADIWLVKTDSNGETTRNRSMNYVFLKLLEQFPLLKLLLNL